MKRTLIAVAAFSLGWGCGPVAMPGGTDGETGATALADLGAEAVAQMEQILAAKAGRSDVQRKISSQLLYARDGLPTGLGKPRAIALQSLLPTDATGRMLVELRGVLDVGLLARIEASGGKVVSVSSGRRSARAWVEPAALEAVAAEAEVRTVRPAMQATTARHDPPRSVDKLGPRTTAQRVAAMERMQRALEVQHPVTASLVGVPATGSVTSQGSRAMGADRARKFFDVDGSGVNIGVLSDSDDGKEQAIALGDLPPDTLTVPGQDGRPGAGEGTAMMEIVHDLAPGARLFFATALNDPESFADNIRTLRFVYHCDVIVDDVVYYFESPYQDDIVAQAVNDVTADGATYLSSAGNEGNFDDGTSGTWEGDFKSGGALSTLPSGYAVHDFGDRVISNRVEVAGGPLILHWSDPGTLDDPRASNDYDLFVLDADLRNVVVAATDIQDGTGLPFEFLGFLIPPGFRVVVAKHPAAAKRAIRVEHFRGELGIATPGAVFGHNAATDALAVAAVDVAEAAGGEFTAGPTTPVEIFSADGNRRHFYHPDGSRIRGGVTFESGGGETRKKPDLAAADGVATSLPPASGLDPFFGTSAAAPHAAAVAGLVRSAVPRASPGRIRNALTGGALDIEARGTDRDSGAGIVSAFNSLQRAGAQPAVFLELGAVTTVSGTGARAILPGGEGQLSVQLINNGGATATAVTAKLIAGSSLAGVTSASADYLDLAPGAAGTNLVPFTFTLDPGTPCGAKIPFTLLITFTGHGSARAFLITVQTGTAGAATTFSYAGPVMFIPDDAPAGTSILLPVSGVGSVSKAVFSIDGTACTDAVGATTVGLDHSWVGDLIATLTSPRGRAVTLLHQAGGPLNNGNNFCQTVLDDAASSAIEDVTVEQAPFTGTFRPASPLSVLVGEPADGTWVLNVSDNAFVDTGSVRAFSLSLAGFGCAP